MGILLLVAGCGQQKEPEKPAPASVASLPSGLFWKQAPAGEAQDVARLKATAKEGEVVLVRGRIGGSKEPFTPGVAVMLLAQRDGLTACSDMQMDPPCPTPWDFCCEVRNKILAHTATVQVVGRDGKPLRLGLKGRGGLAELENIVVQGTVGPRPNKQVLVINANAIHVLEEK